MGFFGPSGSSTGGGINWATGSGAASTFTQTGTTAYQNTTGAGLFCAPTSGTGTVHVQISWDGTNWLDLGTGNALPWVLLPPNWYVRQASGSVTITYSYFKVLQ